MDHHTISEDDIRDQCPYCGSSLAPYWSSTFGDSNQHYKEVTCKCGKKVCKSAGFMGSGHDRWNKNMKNLDKRILEED